MMEKKTLSVLQAGSLRDLVDKVNSINNTSTPVLKDDIVTVFKDEETLFMLYYR